MKSPSPQLLRALRTNLYSKPQSSSLRCPSISTKYRALSTTVSSLAPKSTTKKPLNPKLQTRDRGPRSTEGTQTDFGALDIFSNTPPPATTIDACLSDGFHINNGLKVTGGNGVLLLGGEAFAWSPWTIISDASKPNTLLTKVGAIDLSSEQMFGPLSLVYPLPDLLIIGTGATTRPITKKTRELLASLGVKVDVMDTNNAAASFNLLSTERGTQGVAAAMLPMGW